MKISKEDISRVITIALFLAIIMTLLLSWGGDGCANIEMTHDAEAPVVGYATYIDGHEGTFFYTHRNRDRTIVIIRDDEAVCYGLISTVPSIHCVPRVPFSEMDEYLPPSPGRTE